MILYNGLEVHQAFYRSSGFAPHWSNRTELPQIIGIEGLYNEVLVVRLMPLGKTRL